MSSFDRETEKLIEAEVAKRTRRVRKMLVTMCCITAPCVVISCISAHFAKKNVDQAKEFNKSAQRNADQSRKSAQIAEMNEQLVLNRAKALATEEEKYKQLNVELEHARAELAKTKEDSNTCDRTLASMQQLAATIKKNKDASGQHLADAKELQETCFALADKKFAECKKVCENANLPPFWPQRLSAQPTTPFLNS